MLQFPPHSPAATTPTPATSDGSPGRARPTRPPTPARTRPQRAPTNRNLARPATPGRLPAQPPLTGPLTGGFCTIRRTATACRRRVAPLMLQFPHSPGQERLPHRRQPRRRPWQAHPTPHPRSGSTPRPRPRASQPPATNGATFGQHPLFSQNEIRSTQFA